MACFRLGLDLAFVDEHGLKDESKWVVDVESAARLPPDDPFELTLSGRIWVSMVGDLPAVVELELLLLSSLLFSRRPSRFFFS